jgi:ATP-dependent Zn protease
MYIYILSFVCFRVDRPAPDVIAHLSRHTASFSGADLALLVSEAALCAVK